MDEIFKYHILGVSDDFFEAHGMLRKRFEPIWMYIERFYENEKKSIFSNFSSFLELP